MQINATWLYCSDCKDRYFDTGKRQHGHIPYRDRASQALMRTHAPRERVLHDTNETQEEPEREPEETHEVEPPEPEIGETQTAEVVELSEQEDDDVEEDADKEEEGDQAPEPDEKWPTLEQYREKWDGRLAQHSRVVAGEFSRENLVPEPIPQLFQDCPMCLSTSL